MKILQVLWSTGDGHMTETQRSGVGEKQRIAHNGISSL